MSLAVQSQFETPPWSPPGATGGLDGAFEDELLRAGFSVANLAHARGLSVRQFERKFQHQFGARPREKIHEIRMRLACTSLLSKAALKEISVELCYRDPAHFCYAFRQFYGVSPFQMRWDLRKLTGEAGFMSHFRKRMSHFRKR